MHPLVRLLGVAVVFVFAAVAWLVLGAVTSSPFGNDLLLRFATTHDFTIHNPSRIVRRVLQVADVPAVLVPTDAPEEPAVATTEA